MTLNQLPWTIYPMGRIKQHHCSHTFTIGKERYIANVPLQKSPDKIFHKSLPKALTLDEENFSNTTAVWYVNQNTKKRPVILEQ